MDLKQVLLALYSDDREYARKHMDVRASSSTVLVAVAAGLMTLILNGGIERQDYLFAIVLISLGFFGAFFQLMHCHRERLHLDRAEQYFTELNKEIDVEQRSSGDNRNLVNLESLKGAGDAEVEERGFLLKLGRHDSHLYWAGLQLSIAIIGIVLLVISLNKEIEVPVEVGSKEIELHYCLGAPILE